MSVREHRFGDDALSAARLVCFSRPHVVGPTAGVTALGLGTALCLRAKDAEDPTEAARHVSEALFYLTLRYLSVTESSCWGGAAEGRTGNEADAAASELLDAAEFGHEVCWRKCPGWRAKVEMPWVKVMLKFAGVEVHDRLVGDIDLFFEDEGNR